MTEQTKAVGRHAVCPHRPITTRRENQPIETDFVYPVSGSVHCWLSLSKKKSSIAKQTDVTHLFG